MRTIDAFLSWVQLASWVLLAAAAANLWRRRRDSSAAWLAATFASLAIVLIAGAALGENNDPQGAGLWATKGLLAAIILFPYLLYRFLDSIVPRRRWVWVTAHVLTIGILLATAALPSFPPPHQPRPLFLQVWIVFFLAQWSFLLGHVAWRLWRSGRTQPAVARKRMRTMGAGAFLLAAILVVSAFGPRSSEPGPIDIVTQIVSILSGPLFLIGFAPPLILRAQWRRREELDLRKMEIGIVRALSREQIAEALVPAVVNLLGGRGAALFDVDGTVLGQRGLTPGELTTLREQAPVNAELYQPVAVGDARILSMESGWLIVMSGAFTPFFGTDELQMLSAAAVLADLALGRAKLYELEMQAREAMRDFVAIASHDLRTPVTVIQGFAQVLAGQWDDVTNDQRHEYAAAIARQAQHLDRLIRDLLTVSKLDVNEVDVVTAEVDVAELARHTVAAVAPGIDVAVSTQGLAQASADPDHVARMLQNYVKNALTYGKAPYRVDIVERDEWVTVYVRDSGVGVPEAFLPNLFEKFARVDKKKSRSVQGTGLGLSIVRGLARANGGDAWYEHPTAGTGATFAFRLPRASRTIDPQRAMTGSP